MSAPSTMQNESATLLVIDPQLEGQRKMRERLLAMGYTTRLVDNYESAAGIVSNTPPDVVLLTGQAAGNEGYDELLAMLNQWGIPMLDHRPSSDDSSSDIEESQEATPVTISDEDLKTSIDAALHQRSLQNTLLTENARLNAERLNDPVTGLFNRRYMMIRVEEEITRSSRRGHPLSCMLVDLDGFDKVNEKWGHQAGDTILREVAHLLMRTLRTSDIACRYRDDQFFVLLTDTDASGAQIAANRVRDAVAGHKFTNKVSSEAIRMTTSIGIAYWQPVAKPGQSGTWEPQLIGLSERALKAAKQSGTNRLVILQAA